MKSILILGTIFVLFCATVAQEWTAFVPISTSEACDIVITDSYTLLNLASDSQGRPWQFSGRGFCPNLPAFLRYFDRQSRNWTIAWQTGNSEGPATRYDNLLWIDKDDNVYVYGGTSSGVATCDFWKYSINSKTWANLTVGDGSIQSVQKGAENSNNYPGCRRGSGYWYTPDDNSIWLFSGYGVSSADPQTPDLWRFNVTSQKWAFVAGLLDIITTDEPVFNDAFEVTPFQRYGAFSAVDADYNLWLYGGELMDDLWMFDRSTGWKYVSGNKNYSSYDDGCTATLTQLPAGVFSSQHRPDCAAYSSMTYAGANMLALWTSYTNSDKNSKLWLYNITSQEWAYYNDVGSGSAVANVLYEPDASSTPGDTGFTRAISPHSLWIISDQSSGVFVMDFPQCTQGVNPCSVHATCTENIARVLPTCTCNEGYEGDGFTCNAVTPTSAGAPSTSGTPTSSSPNNSPKGSTSAASINAVHLLSHWLVLMLLL